MRFILKKLFKAKYFLWIIPFATLLILIDGLWYENSVYETNFLYFKGATQSTDNIRIVQLSDVHFKGIDPTLLKIISDVNALKPDLICFTGDMLHLKRFAPDLGRFLSLFNKSIKMVAITGNWEYWSKTNIKLLDSIYKAEGCDLLINRSEQIKVRGRIINVSGIDDMVGGRPDLAKTLRNYREGDINIFLTHCPLYRDVLIKQKKPDINFDIVMAGHTHGGQLNILGYIPYLPLGIGRYYRGYFNDEKPPLYVNRGISNGFFPLRIGSRTEITVYEFKR